MVVVSFSVVGAAVAGIVVSPAVGKSLPEAQAASTVASAARPVLNRMVLVIKDRTPWEYRRFRPAFAPALLGCVGSPTVGKGFLAQFVEGASSRVVRVGQP